MLLKHVQSLNMVLLNSGLNVVIHQTWFQHLRVDPTPLGRKDSTPRSLQSLAWQMRAASESRIRRNTVVSEDLSRDENRGRFWASQEAIPRTPRQTSGGLVSN